MLQCTIFQENVNVLLQKSTFYRCCLPFRKLSIMRRKFERIFTTFQIPLYIHCLDLLLFKVSAANMTSSKVYIGNLGEDGDEEEIRQAFGKFGILKEVWVAKNPPGFAFAVYNDPCDAEEAVRVMDNKRLCGVRIKAQLSHSERKSNNREGGGRGRGMDRNFGDRGPGSQGFTPRGPPSRGRPGRVASDRGRSPIRSPKSRGSVGLRRSPGRDHPVHAPPSRGQFRESPPRALMVRRSPARGPVPRRSPPRGPHPPRRSPLNGPPQMRRSPLRGAPPDRRSPLRGPAPLRGSPPRNLIARHGSPIRGPPPRRGSPLRRPPSDWSPPRAQLTRNSYSRRSPPRGMPIERSPQRHLQMHGSPPRSLLPRRSPPRDSRLYDSPPRGPPPRRSPFGDQFARGPPSRDQFRPQVRGLLSNEPRMVPSRSSPPRGSRSAGFSPRRMSPPNPFTMRNEPMDRFDRPSFAMRPPNSPPMRNQGRGDIDHPRDFLPRGRSPPSLLEVGRFNSSVNGRFSDSHEDRNGPARFRDSDMQRQHGIERGIGRGVGGFVDRAGSLSPERGFGRRPRRERDAEPMRLLRDGASRFADRDRFPEEGLSRRSPPPRLSLMSARFVSSVLNVITVEKFQFFKFFVYYFIGTMFLPILLLVSLKDGSSLFS